MDKTIIISDIHGCYEQLKSLLHRSGFDERSDRLFVLGDMIDRGKQSFEVIEELKRLKAMMGERCILLRGNHEQILIEAVTGKGFGDAYSIWRNNGANKTISSLRAHGLRPEDVVGFCQGLKLYHETEDFICVHAGISDKGLKQSTVDTLVWDRTVVECGWYQGKLLICGHTPREEVIYRQNPNKGAILKTEQTFLLPKTGSICIDTGCVWGGKLSALVIKGKEAVVCSVEGVKRE